MVRGDSPSGGLRKVLVCVAIGVGVALLALSGLRHVHTLFPAETQTSCTSMRGIDKHQVRGGPDYATIETDCGSFITKIEVTCSADPSRTVFLLPAVTYDLTVRGPRVWIFSEPTIVEAQVATAQTAEPEPEPVLGDDPTWDNLKAFRASFSPEVLRAFDYEQPPFDPRCDAMRTVMTTAGLQIVSPAKADELLQVPAGLVARDPKLPCEGWKCSSE